MIGDPEVKILSPRPLREIVTSSIRLSCVGDGQYEVNYAPEVVGDHQVEVKMVGLIVKTYDASFVVVMDIQPHEVWRHSPRIQYGGHHVPGSPFQMRDYHNIIFFKCSISVYTVYQVGVE